MIALVAAGYVVGKNRGGGGAASTTATTGGGGAAGPGKQAFVDKCGSCHALSAAGTTANVGPNLDQLKPAAVVTFAQIKNGGATMPAGLASGKEAKAIADFVAKATSGGAPKTAPTGGGATADPGKQAFIDKCGSCHTLAAAGTTGNSGPSLDDLKPPAAVTLAQIKNGGGAMPAGLASGKIAKAIADYVAKATGGG